MFLGNTDCYNTVFNPLKEDALTHKDEGHYAGKHHYHVTLDQTLTEAIKRRSSEGKVSCAAAFTVARELKMKPSEVGEALDLLEIKVVKCQLGLFGYQKRPRLVVQPAEEVPLELEKALRAGLVNGRLSCAAAWSIAKRFNMPKMTITAACESLKLRLAQCQLGTF